MTKFSNKAPRAECIDNNNGANSYVKPTLTSTSGTFKTGDGYVWKYMYSVDSSSNSKFTTTNYIPVSTNAAVQGNATPGSIDVIQITDGGNSYFVYETGYIGGMVNKYVVQLAKSMATALPIPLPAPVMMMICFMSLRSILISLSFVLQLQLLANSFQ